MRSWMLVFLVGCGGSQGASDAATPDADPAQRWQPAPGTSWQWQLSGTIDTSFDVAMYDVDLVDAPDAVLTTLRDRGTRVVCYFSAGSYEEWRADADEFPAATLGNPLDGWPGERWLDVRSDEVRAIMRARLDLARDRGCDAVEPDNVDGHDNDTGFAITEAEQRDFLTFLQTEAHARGLSIGLKNALGLIPDLVDQFDWSLNEECFAFDECDLLDPFVAAGKAVFQVEYGAPALAATICDDANAHDFDTLIKDLELGPERTSCR